MSVNNTPSIPGAAGMPIGPTSYATLSGMGMAVSTSTPSKTPISSQVVYPSASNLPVKSSSQSIISKDFPHVMKKPTTVPSSCVAPTAAGTLTMNYQKQAIPGSILTLPSTPARPVISQPAKTHGKHHLPVRPLPVCGISHVIPRCGSSSATVTTALDPGGGSIYTCKPTVLPTSIIAPVAKSARNYPQVPFHIQPVQHQVHTASCVSVTASKPIISVTTARTQQPILVRSIPAPGGQGQAAASFSIPNTQDLARRQNSIQHQPTTTISVSIPARSSTSLHESSQNISCNLPSRINLPVSHPILPSNSTAGSSTHTMSNQKIQKVVLSPQAVSSTLPTRTITLTTSAPPTIITSASAFNYSTAAQRRVTVTSITTSAVPIAKVYAQPQVRIHGVQPAVSGVTVHARTTEFHHPLTAIRQPSIITITSAQSQASVAVTVATSLTAPRPSTQSVIPPMLYWDPNSTINLNPSYSSQSVVSASFAGSNTANHPVQISSLLVMEAARIATGNSTSISGFSGGQVLHTVSTTQTSGSDQQLRLLQPHASSLQVSSAPPQHVPNMSPKPAILRRPGRVDSSINKKLNFQPESRVAGRMSPMKSDHRNSHGSSAVDTGLPPNKHRYPVSQHDQLYQQANIKPVLPGQVAFPKPTVTSNGITATSKLGRNSKDFAIYRSNVEKIEHQQHSSVGRYPQQTISEIKLKTEPSPGSNTCRLPLNIKTETASTHLAQQQQFHSLFHHQQQQQQQNHHHHDHPIASSKLATQQDDNPQLQAHQEVTASANKVRPLLQRGNMLTVTALPNRAVLPHSTSSHHQQATGADVSTLLTQPVSAPASSQQDTANGNFRTSESPITSTPHRTGAKLPVALSGIKREHDAISTSPERLHYPVPATYLPDAPLTPNLLAGQQSPIGLSPRKKPRKQTHIVAEELPDDEMSTDDADEGADERNALPDAPSPLDKKTPAAPNSSLKSRDKSSSSTPVIDQKSKSVCHSSASSQSLNLSEYVDEHGVRYVPMRERPPISLLCGHRAKPITNHFQHYADVKVKAEKRPSFYERCFDQNKINGWKLNQFAVQLDELIKLDACALKRIENVKEGLLEYCNAMLSSGGNALPPSASVWGDVVGCSGGVSPAHISQSTPSIGGTPTQSAVAHAFSGLCYSTNSFSGGVAPSCNGPLSGSPMTPVERKVFKFHDEILRVEEMAQANIQRCNVIQDQLVDARLAMLKVLDHRGLVGKVVEAGRSVQKGPSKFSSSNGSRTSKKKKS